jgi:thioredoxin 1
MSNAIHLTAANFDAEVLKSDKPVLVDLWAAWCGPCRMIGPVLDEIAASDERFKITKIDTEAQPELASKLGVRALPTLMFFKDGALADQIVGAVPKKTIVSKLEALLPVPA